MPRKHFTNKTLNSTTHNQNPIYLQKFVHRLHSPMAAHTHQISLPLFVSLKTHKPIPLSLQNHHSLTLSPHKPINLLLCFFFFSHRRPWPPHPEISLPSLPLSQNPQIHLSLFQNHLSLSDLTNFHVLFYKIHGIWTGT